MTDHAKKSLGLGLLLGVLATLLTALFIALIVVYTGAYDVSATREHPSFARWALDTTMHNSVERQAASFEGGPPEDVDLRAGGAAYAAMCAQCHAAPGAERSSFAKGMRPSPPHLTEHAAGWSEAEIRWILENGIRMSGMPSFGATHDDEALWEITAFVKALPGMSEARYAELTADASSHDEDGHAH